MPAWFSSCWMLLFGRATPRVLPASNAALLQAAALYAVASMVDAALVFKDGRAVGFGFADLLFTAIATALILLVRRRLHRWPQTVLALLVVGFLLTLPSIAFNAVFGASVTAGAERHGPLVIELLLAGVLCWSIVIVARIMRAALDVDFVTGMAVSLTYFLTDYLVLVALPARIAG